MKHLIPKTYFFLLATLFLLFLFTSCISFLGSVQLGPVNAMVIQTTINKSLRAGLWVAFGGCLPEIIYALLALEGNRFLAPHTNILRWLEFAVAPIFLLIGISTLFQQRKMLERKADSTHQFLNKNPFFVGFSLGFLNPQLLPFWLTVLLYLKTYFIIESCAMQVAFVTGTAFGAFSILALFAWATKRYEVRLMKVFDNFPIGYIVGAIFVFLGLFQGLKTLF